VLRNRHTGEELAMWRVWRDGQVVLALRGSLPAHRQGPPLHTHIDESEMFEVVVGSMSAQLSGRTITVGVGERATFAAGVAHRWWNDGDELLIAEGHASPVRDLDRYLQAMFDVLNAGSTERPSLIYMAHVAWRHRRTQVVLMIPRAVQAILFPLIILTGTLLGRYRGSDWPGSPQRSPGAPLLEREQ
jgi:mannose-6-phosphate isomerase-like protein (cupin superfamily)